MSILNTQLIGWLNGNPSCDGQQCCPDFSCCGQPLAPKEVRERFCKAYEEDDQETQMEMLGMFLAKAFSGQQVYVAGLTPTEEGEQ